MKHTKVTTCSILPISRRVNAKITPASVKWVKETRLSLHVGPTSCYCKSQSVNGPLAGVSRHFSKFKNRPGNSFKPQQRASAPFCQSFELVYLGTQSNQVECVYLSEFKAQKVFINGRSKGPLPAEAVSRRTSPRGPRNDVKKA